MTIVHPDSNLIVLPGMNNKRPRQRGFVLIASLLILIVLTFLAISMSRSFAVQQRMAANLQEKARAFQIAQSTLAYSESLLASQAQNLPRRSSCPATLSVATICSTPISITNPTTTSPLAALSSATSYSTMQPAITVSGNGGSGAYYAFPTYYIQYLGLTPGGKGQLYQVTALGYGGNPNAVAVVQSTYQVTSGISNLGGL